MEHILFRVPIILGYNTKEDANKSIEWLTGYGKTERFEYKVHNVVKK